jgi:hypothetical protein
MLPVRSRRRSPGTGAVTRSLPSRLKPARGFSHLLYITLNALLPILAYILVKIDFVGLAVALVMLSKWRMFAVRPRYWLVNLIQNGVDIMVAISLIIFMATTTVVWWQLIWMVAYEFWLLWLKPRFDEESHSALIAHIWAYFSASLAFVLAHWLLFYGTVAQIIVILTTVGYGLAALYYLDATDRLSQRLQKQLMGIMLAILLIIVLFSNWTGATI